MARVGEIMGEVKSVTDADFDNAINADEWVLVISGLHGVDRARLWGLC